ncbi:MAG: tRNA pseudouridine(55) synthase TruB [Candidatus Harrisonbacteria bacterium CG10_big_fil_rev_8_21_14_0_10_49_15]|uniref:tRNA pseudouridine synthase B n=1 Tax=Candidatus Harrisonbacteria bacterium CG10_big_fil_rev_8_21_14_0_10_49_15 TaxID=1974587 RepID=A0A2H0UM19_9BACT|nr:MAG: tRNA pseudouridine(55) synthase TruB [Candidatus Harrisonbacteria bacterium CG10_big_fil_rev_8_21_14_0_10_49_15]
MSESDILLIDKLKGITSFDVIRRLRRIRQLADGRYPKMGHAGTLDPLASGLMLIGVDKGTKKLTELVGLDKTYIAEVLLGKQTSTGDMEGKIVVELPVDEERVKKEIAAVLAGMVGELELAVSIYSAIKKDGKALYKYARAGQAVEAPIRKMIIHEARLLKLELPIVEVEFSVASGVYVRSLGEELGRRLGTVATLANLRRTCIGPYRVEDAQGLEDLEIGKLGK